MCFLVQKGKSGRKAQGCMVWVSSINTCFYLALRIPMWWSLVGLSHNILEVQELSPETQTPGHWGSWIPSEVIAWKINSF